MFGEGWSLLFTVLFIHPSFFSLFLSPSLSNSQPLSFPTLALYTISPFHLQGPVKLSCKFNSMQSFSFRFSRRSEEKRAAAERKGRRQPTTPSAAATITTEVNPVAYASALRIRFEDNRRCGVTRAPCELNQFETEGGGRSVSGSTSLHQLS